MNILLIDRTSTEFVFICNALKVHSVDFASYADVVKTKLMKIRYDAILVDAACFSDEGDGVLNILKSSKENNSIPLFVLGDHFDIELGIEGLWLAGKFAKPLNAFEMQTKLEALTSNKNRDQSSATNSVKILLDLVSHEINYSDLKYSLHYRLTPMEFKLFMLLYESANQVVPRDRAFALLWKKKTAQLRRNF